MKINIFKTIIPAAAMVLTMSTTSCVGDLDVTPINPQQTMDLNGDALFNKIYASFSLTGQTGPNGSGDLDDGAFVHKRQHRNRLQLKRAGAIGNNPGTMY